MIYCLIILLLSNSLTESYSADFAKPSVDVNKAGDRYVYTRPASTTNGTTCIGDCIGEYCVVDMYGSLHPCCLVDLRPPLIFYTSQTNKQKIRRCRSACVRTNGLPWCYISEFGDTDNCNPDTKDNNNIYPNSINADSGLGPNMRCLTPCRYQVTAGAYRCKVTSHEWRLCAPFADIGTPLQPPSSTITNNTNVLKQCISQPNLIQACPARRKRETDNDEDTDSDHDADTCLATDNPDHLDVFRLTDTNNRISYASPGTVINDAHAFQDVGSTNTEPPAPLTSYTTTYNSELQLNLPVVIRARIDIGALDTVVTPRPTNVIQRTVPSLRRALSTVRYSYQNIIYDVGHMIGYQSGGPDADYNYAPQAHSLNVGPWLQMEGFIRRWVRSMRPYAYVDMLIVVYYDREIRYMPLSFGVNLAFYYSQGRLASMCNDIVFFNHGNPRSSH